MLWLPWVGCSGDGVRRPSYATAQRSRAGAWARGPTEGIAAFPGSSIGNRAWELHCDAQAHSCTIARSSTWRSSRPAQGACSVQLYRMKLIMWFNRQFVPPSSGAQCAELKAAICDVHVAVGEDRCHGPGGKGESPRPARGGQVQPEDGDPGGHRCRGQARARGAEVLAPAGFATVRTLTEALPARCFSRQHAPQISSMAESCSTWRVANRAFFRPNSLPIDPAEPVPCRPSRQ